MALNARGIGKRCGAVRCLPAHLATQSSQHAQLAEKEHIEVHRFIITHEMGVPARIRRVAFNTQYYFWLVFLTCGILDCDDTLPGIEVHHHLLGSASTPDPQISQYSFFTRQSLFLGHRVPLHTLCNDRV